MLDLLRTRRSVPPRLLQAPGPSADEITSLLEIASRVPDHGKLVPWRFILFEGEGLAQAGEVIAQVYAADNPEADDKRLKAERERLASAPVVIAVVSRAAPHVKIPEWEQVLSSGAVAMTLTIAANAMGYATSWLTEWYAYDRRVLDLFGLAPHERIAGFVHIGTPVERQTDRPRPPLSEIVSRFPG
jgi:nitroreductase